MRYVMFAIHRNCHISRQALNNLAVNDSNKQRIVDCGALPFYVQLLKPEYQVVEQSEAARGIWTLAFNPKCKERILKEKGCLEGEVQQPDLISHLFS